jgi:molecular chaperone HscA
MLSEGFSNADADMGARALAEARVEAERMRLATLAALRADGDLLSAEERAAIEELLVLLQTTAQTTDHSAINTAVENLAHGTEAFAALRMNRSIQQALSGRSVDSL